MTEKIHFSKYSLLFIYNSDEEKRVATLDVLTMLIRHLLIHILILYVCEVDNERTGLFAMRVN